MADRPPILSFTTLLKGEPIEINGARYQIRHPDGLSVWDLKTIEQHAPRLGELFERDDLSASERTELDQLLRAITDLALDAPVKIRAALTHSHRIAILQVFTALRSPNAVRMLTAAAVLNRRTGAISSRGSNGATAAAQTSGSSARRSRSSGRT